MLCEYTIATLAVATFRMLLSWLVFSLKLFPEEIGFDPADDAEHIAAKYVSPSALPSLGEQRIQKIDRA